MQHILVLGGGAAGLAAALAAAQTAKGSARITVLDRNAKVGKKLLATGNGRCNLDNRDISPERYFTSSPKALRRLLDAVNEAAPLAWFEGLGLYPRTDEAGRVYPYSNQAADVLALLEHHLAALGVELRTGCTIRSLSQSRGGYDLQFETEAGRESLRADAVICAMGGEAGPQFGTDGFGTRFAAQCGGRVEPLYPCLTALQCAKPRKALAGIRAKAAASLLDGARVLACENGEVQFTDYGLSGICIMQLSGLLAPGRGPKAPAVELDLFPAVDETALASLFAAHAAQTAGGSAADFWLGLLNQKLGRTVWSAAGLQDSDAPAVLTAAQWQKLAHTAKHWRFEGLTPCSWKQAQTTGGGLALREVDQHFQFKGCPGLYFVGETLDCAGSCGGFNLHWAFGSGLVAGRSAAGHAAAGRALPKASAPAKSRKKPHR
jgi:predicted Rossmann fold flavoprotein